MKAKHFTKIIIISISMFFFSILTNFFFILEHFSLFIYFFSPFISEEDKTIYEKNYLQIKEH